MSLVQNVVMPQGKWTLRRDELAVNLSRKVSFQGVGRREPRLLQVVKAYSHRANTGSRRQPEELRHPLRAARFKACRS